MTSSGTKQDGLVIRETKFRKSRLVPLHETTVAALERYLQRRRLMAGNDEHLFVSLSRRKLSLVSATRTFRQIVKTAGLPDRPGRPRLYNLRHWFATRTLELCPDNRDGIHQHMLALTTYLGLDITRCPRCKMGTLTFLARLPACKSDPAAWDSS